MTKLFFFLVLVIIGGCRTASINSLVYETNQIKFYKLENADTLVDIGSGNGIHDIYISRFYNNLFFILEDINQKTTRHRESYFRENRIFAEFINRKHKSIIGSPDSIPLRSNAYTNLLCSKSFHEFEYKKKMITEIARVVRPGGKFLVVETKPFYPGEIAKYCKYPLLEKDAILLNIPKDLFRLEDYTEMPTYRKRVLMIFVFSRT